MNFNQKITIYVKDYEIKQNLFHKYLKRGILLLATGDYRFVRYFINFVLKYCQSSRICNLIFSRLYNL